jgi:hypothetical protein
MKKRHLFLLMILGWGLMVSIPVGAQDNPAGRTSLKMFPGEFIDWILAEVSIRGGIQDIIRREGWGQPFAFMWVLPIDQEMWIWFG